MITALSYNSQVKFEKVQKTMKGKGRKSHAERLKDWVYLTLKGTHPRTYLYHGTWSNVLSVCPPHRTMRPGLFKPISSTSQVGFHEIWGHIYTKIIFAVYQKFKFK